MSYSKSKTLDRVLTGPMFVASLAFLVCLAGWIQETRFGPMLPGDRSLFGLGLLLIYLLFLIEAMLHWMVGSRAMRQHLWICLLPPLRLGGRDHVTGQAVWLPGLGWRRADRELHNDVEKAFSGPMIAIALAVLPALALEFFWWKASEGNSVLAFLLVLSTSIIWLAFAIELCVMVSIVDKKIRYCSEHMIDVIVVVLPFFAFLRTFRLASLLRLEQVSRLSRMYRLRGLAVKAYRAVLLMDVVRRLAERNPEKRLAVLRERLLDAEHEAEQIRKDIRLLEERIAAEAGEDQDAPSSVDAPPPSASKHLNPS